MGLPGSQLSLHLLSWQQHPAAGHGAQGSRLGHRHGLTLWCSCLLSRALPSTPGEHLQLLALKQKGDDPQETISQCLARAKHSGKCLFSLHVAPGVFCSSEVRPCPS